MMAIALNRISCRTYGRARAPAVTKIVHTKRPLLERRTRAVAQGPGTSDQWADARAGTKWRRRKRVRYLLAIHFFVTLPCPPGILSLKFYMSCVERGLKY